MLRVLGRDVILEKTCGSIADCTFDELCGRVSIAQIVFLLLFCVVFFYKEENQCRHLLKSNYLLSGSVSLESVLATICVIVNFSYFFVFLLRLTCCVGHFESVDFKKTSICQYFSESFIKICAEVHEIFICRQVKTSLPTFQLLAFSHFSSFIFVASLPDPLTSTLSSFLLSVTKQSC